jgi:hypothetical protein
LNGKRIIKFACLLIIIIFNFVVPHFLF